MLKYLTVIVVFVMLIVFIYFAAFSYGTIPLSAKDIQQMMWKESWDFLILNKSK